MRTFATAAVLFLLPAIARGQQDAATLNIQFSGGGSVFQIGQIIPVELSFTAAGGGTYLMSSRAYDRSGRLNIEEFHVDPPGRDPLREHFEGGVFMGGGLSGDKTLSADPETVREELNEWVALDKPGHYSLYVTTSRVHRQDGTKFEQIPLRSNTLEFDVVEADPAWQAQTLGTAAAVLRDSASTPEEKKAAARTLRFLDTPDSVRELAHQLAAPGDESRWEFQAGILGSRHRQEAVSALDAEFAAPDAGITESLIFSLSETKLLLDHPPLGPYPSDDPEKQKAWSGRQQAIVKQHDRIQEELYARAAQLVSSKNAAARAETVNTLLLRPDDGSGMQPLTGVPDAEIASAFALMTPQQQATLLQSFWERMKLPAMARALEGVLQHPDRGDEMLRAEALKRLYDLDPREGRSYIVAEIRSPHMQVGNFLPKVLTLLPDETLPELDGLLATRLEDPGDQTAGMDARIVARYATAAILPRVKAIYEKRAGQSICDVDDGLIRYFLRTDPDYGLERIRSSAKPCMEQSLKAVAAVGHWPAVEPVFIGQLNGSDGWTARQAAETLARYGSAQAQKALWQRLAAFHKKWADRGAELVWGRDMPHEASDAIALESGLLESLGHAQAWLLDNDRITELEGLAVSEGERQNVKSWHWQSPVNVTLIAIPGGQIQIIAGSYSVTDTDLFQAKLAQYPSGTVFHLSSSGNADRLAPVLRAIRETASDNGLVVETEP